MTDWVIPTITAAASLSGTVVGGLATYWTSKKMQRVIYCAFAQEITTTISPDKHNAATEAFNQAINEFVNRVRHHMHVEDHDFDVDRQALDTLLGP